MKLYPALEAPSLGGGPPVLPLLEVRAPTRKRGQHQTEPSSWRNLGLSGVKAERLLSVTRRRPQRIPGPPQSIPPAAGGLCPSPSPRCPECGEPEASQENHSAPTINFVNSRSTVIHRGKGTSSWDFPGGPVVRTSRFHCRGHGFDPWLGN